jgi:dodecin
LTQAIKESRIKTACETLLFG